MTKSIYKFHLKNAIFQAIKLPKGAEILTIQAQFDEPELWALVDPIELQEEERHIEVFGTGEAVKCDMGIERKYISTCQFSDGNYVFHFFERIN